MSSRRFPIPCLTCGQLTRNGSYCDHHTRPDNPSRKEKKRLLYDTDYKRQAKLIRDTAVECWICKEGPRPHDPFEADHLYPGVRGGPLLAAHRTCNQKRGNRPPV